MLKYLWVFGLVALASAPLIGVPQYYLHILISILIWSFIYTSWSLMGRFGLVSLGHGAFLSIGAYGTALLWNTVGLSPWLGIPLAVGVSALVAAIIGAACFSLRITGHYFALATLALSEVVRLFIIATRDYTGGSLGLTPKLAAATDRFVAFQFETKEAFFLLALGIWLFGLFVWQRVDRSMLRYALEATVDDEDAAAAAGVWVTGVKLQVIVLSAAMTAFGGAIYTQYQMFIAPETVGGISISLQIVFAVVAGGLYTMLGPTVGAIITIVLAEGLRIAMGASLAGLDTSIYGAMLIVFIILMPEGIVGKLTSLANRQRRASDAAGAPAKVNA